LEPSTTFGSPVTMRYQVQLYCKRFFWCGSRGAGRKPRRTGFAARFSLGRGQRNGFVDGLCGCVSRSRRW